MSTIMSISTLAEQETLLSKSSTDLRRPIEVDSLQPQDAYGDGTNYLRRNTDLGPAFSIEPAFFEANPNKLKRWREHALHHGSLSNSQDEDAELDFYEEVDERMSRNSVEYPEQQAKYIHNWLQGAHNSFKSKSCEEDDSSINKGNVIGIRGFMSDKYLIDNNERLRERYNRLQYDHTKLQTDHEKLKSRFDETMHKHEKIFKKKDYDTDLLKAMMAKKSSNEEKARSRQPVVNGENQAECQHLRHQIKMLESKLSYKEAEYEQSLELLRKENDRMRKCVEDSRLELDNLKNQVRSLSFEPDQRLLLSLKEENSRLKSMSNIDMVDYAGLRDNYSQLESQLKGLMNDQKCSTREKDEEIARLLSELCRLQVYQPKLETILSKERQIKAELQKQLDEAESEKEKLTNQLALMRQELTTERLRVNNAESIEISELQNEVVRWQENYHRLKQEKNQIEELLRTLRGKLSMFDAKRQSDLEQLNESHKNEREQLRVGQMKLENERNLLASKLNLMSDRLSQCELEKQKLNESLIEASKQLEMALVRQETEDRAVKRLKKDENRVVDLLAQIETFEIERKSLSKELEICRKQLEENGQQIAQSRHRFELQQKAYDELRDRSNKEITRLRVDLNFEQYNRQVALKAIERELRASLKELEAMKYRFSRRLGRGECNLPQSISKPRWSSPTTTTTMSSTTTKSKEGKEENEKENEEDLDGVGSNNSNGSIHRLAGKTAQQSRQQSVARLMAEPLRGDTSH